MFVPRSGRGPPDPLQAEVSSPGPAVPDVLGRVGAQVLSAMGVPSGALAGDGPLSASELDGPRPGGAEAEEERGPDRLADMPGGAEAMVRVRRARRRELLKEGANVAVGALVAAVVTGTVLLEGGVDPPAALVTAVGAAGGWGWILGREVLADLARNTEFLQRDRDVW